MGRLTEIERLGKLVEEEKVGCKSERQNREQGERFRG